MTSKLLGALIGAASVLLVAGQVHAVTLPSVSGPESLTTLVRGCHRSVDIDDYSAHVHVGRDCRRVEVDRQRPRYYEERPRYEGRRPRQRCEEVCQYIGPIKQCKTVCR